MLDSVPQYLPILFILLVVLVADLFVGGLFLAARKTKKIAQQWVALAAMGIGVFLAVPAILAALGWVPLNTVPPRLMMLVAVMTLITIWVAFSKVGDLLLTLGPVALIGFQVFRVPVELFLHKMYTLGVIPVQMTYAGLNYDIVAGLTAPVIAWLFWKKRIGRTGVLIWNIVCLALLLNIVTIAVLSAPVPFRVFMNEPANTFVTHFPYVWLPTLLVQAALFGHLLVFRWWARN